MIAFGVLRLAYIAQRRTKNRAAAFCEDLRGKQAGLLELRLLPLDLAIMSAHPRFLEVSLQLFLSFSDSSLIQPLHSVATIPLISPLF